jgi:hypothetical protein
VTGEVRRRQPQRPARQRLPARPARNRCGGEHVSGYKKGARLPQPWPAHCAPAGLSGGGRLRARFAALEKIDKSCPVGRWLGLSLTERAVVGENGSRGRRQIQDQDSASLPGREHAGLASPTSRGRGRTLVARGRNEPADPGGAQRHLADRAGADLPGRTDAARPGLDPQAALVGPGAHGVHLPGRRRSQSPGPKGSGRDARSGAVRLCPGPLRHLPLRTGHCRKGTRVCKLP